MKEFLKRKFAITDQGVSAIRNSSIASLFVNFGYMAFMMVALYFGDNLLKGDARSWSFYLLICNVWLGLSVIIPVLLGLLMIYVSKSNQKKWTAKYYWRSREHSVGFPTSFKQSVKL